MRRRPEPYYNKETKKNEAKFIPGQTRNNEIAPQEENNIENPC